MTRPFFQPKSSPISRPMKPRRSQSHIPNCALCCSKSSAAETEKYLICVCKGVVYLPAWQPCGRVPSKMETTITSLQRKRSLYVFRVALMGDSWERLPVGSQPCSPLAASIAILLMIRWDLPLRSLFCFAVVSLWRNANLAGGLAFRRFWWFVVLFLFDDLPFSYETKAFHAEGPSLRAIPATTEEKKQLPLPPKGPVYVLVSRDPNVGPSQTDRWKIPDMCMRRCWIASM